MTNEGNGAGLIMVSPKGHTYEHALKFLFKASNNKGEYEALLADMDLCHTLGAERLRAFSDSQPVVSQVKGEYEVHDVTMVAYLSKVKEKSQAFKNFEIKTLSKLASSMLDAHPKSIRWEILHQPTIASKEIAWMDRIET